MALLSIQPSQLLTSGASGAGQMIRGIPSAGLAAGPVRGSPTCGNLFAYDPPGPLEDYSIASYSIAAAAAFSNGVAFAAGITMAIELAFLLNGRPAYIVTQNGLATILVGNGAFANTMFTGDLVNPIRMTWSDQLSLRMGVSCSAAASVSSGGVVGAQLDQNAVGQGVDSTITYETPSLDQ